MPQSPERKREYMREYMRGQRQAKGSRLGFAKVSPQRGEESEKGVSPRVSPLSDTGQIEGLTTLGRTLLEKRKHRVSPFHDLVGGVQPDRVRMYQMPGKHLVAYMTAIAFHGYGLALTSQGYEFVDLATGQIGFGSAPTYQQTPTTKTLKETTWPASRSLGEGWTPVGRTEAAEQRIMALEADLARLEAMLDSVMHETREGYDEAG